MTVEADQIRTRRQAFAAPDGSHDRLIGWLNKVLPTGIGVVVALMVVVPLTPRGEVSFLLDRNKVEIAENRLRVDNAMYRGQDSKGRPFSLTAGQAVQLSASKPVVQLRNLEARILLPDGPALLGAASGHYDLDEERVEIDGLLQFTATDGYRMTMRDVSIDLEEKTLISNGRTEGAIPAGTFSADQIIANLEERTITLNGHARLRMTPGDLRIP